MRVKDGEGNWDYVRCPNTGNIIPSVVPRYRKVAGKPDAPIYGYATVATGAATPGTDCVFPSLNKALDGSRFDVTSADGGRDWTIARLAETYLIAAEVKVRQGDYAGALPYINKIRARAAYKENEDRGDYVDGGHYFKTGNPASSYITRNSYYISNNLPTTVKSATDLTINSTNNLPTQDEAIIAKLGISGEFERMMCLILNERTRELAGELLRWEDLARTKTLVKRTLTYNEDAIYETRAGGGLKEHHYLRPIPQAFLDQIWQNGKPLTTEEKKAMQNPGYN